jgi:hypothetical protein
MEFNQIIEDELKLPLISLCGILASEEEFEQFAFFAAIIPLLEDENREDQVLLAVLELSRCAFLGFHYSPTTALLIDQLLERAITLSHTMSAESLQ